MLGESPNRVNEWREMIKCPKEIKEGCDEWDQCESDDMPRDKNSFMGITGWRKKEKEG